MYRHPGIAQPMEIEGPFFEGPFFENEYEAEAEYEDEFESEDAPLFWYYWVAYHKPPNSDWVAKSPLPPQQFQVTSAAADYLDQQALNQASQTVPYSPGLLYVGRYNWNGTNWYRDRCHMIDLTSKQNWSC